jgi:hypothetical protein
MTNSIKIEKEGTVFTFTQINNKFYKNYESENGYMIQFSYKNEKSYLLAIKKCNQK